VGLSGWVWNIGFALLGLAMVLWATPLSVRYTAWVSRRRYPWRPMMSDEWLARNLPTIYRILGALLILRSVVEIARFGLK
jgi:hypothetical protein